MIQSSQPNALKLTKNLCLQHWSLASGPQSSALLLTRLFPAGAALSTRKGLDPAVKGSLTALPHPEQSKSSSRGPRPPHDRTPPVTSRRCQLPPPCWTRTPAEPAISVYSSNSFSTENALLMSNELF